MDVDAVAEALYLVDPSDFVKTRTDYVRRARESKDRAAAREIAALKKPTTTGWVVNLLAHTLPEELDSVSAVGDELRRAQRSLDAELLRELTARRQQLVRALTARAGTLAQERGHRLGENVLREVSQTLHAAMMDPDVAASVRRGRVLAAASYSGFGTAGLEAVDDTETETGTDPDAPGGGATGIGVTDSEVTDSAVDDADRRAAAAEARAELDASHRDAEDARVALADAEHRLGEVAAERAEAAERLDRLRRELRQVSERVAFLQRSEQAAGESVASAREAALQADGRVAAAEDAVSAIDESGTR